MTESQIVPFENVGRLIRVIRGQKVLLDSDLAILYGVETKALNRNVRRHIRRFPDDFMFQLNREEFLRCQIGTSKSRGGRRYYPFAFTEQGVAMLSSVLNSDLAIDVNIAIMRAFVQLRHVSVNNKALAKKFNEIETRLKGYDKNSQVVFATIRKLLEPQKEDSDRKIGFGRSIPEDTVS